VTIQLQVTRGTCYPCTHGAYHICDNLKVMGFRTTGAGTGSYEPIDPEAVYQIVENLAEERIEIKK
jgi:L-iditol 2-dehydrogenase